jgi:GNAT superfamily N-acetyltransferase
VPKTKNLVVRPARETDFEAVCEMVKALAAHHDDNATLQPAHLNTYAEGADSTLRFLLACMEDRTVGYAALERRVQLTFARHFLDMQHLYVIPAFRDKGIGSALVDASVKLAQKTGCAALTVGTAIGNDRAAQFYRKSGFEDSPVSGPRFAIVF